MSKQRRYLIASLGSIGRRHLRNLRMLRPDSEIAILRRPEQAGEAPPAEASRQFGSLAEALDFGPDAAILAGPATTHVPLALELVDRSIAVLIEKPLSHDLAGVAELRRRAAIGRVPVMIGYNLRYNPALIAFRERLLAGVLGDIWSVRAEVGQYLPGWRPQADYRQGVSASAALGGGVLLELSHEIDYIYWLFGMPDRVTARGGKLSSLEIDVEDLVELCLEYDRPRRLVNIHLDFLQRTVTRSCKAIGAYGNATWDGMRDLVTLALAEPEQLTETIELPMADRNQMYVDELRAFLASAEERAPIQIGLDEAADVLAIVMAARKSMASGKAEYPTMESPT